MSVTRCRASCDYCGLLLSDSNSPPAALASSAEPHEPRYCCYGCRFAAGVAQASGDTAQARWLMTRLGLSAFFTMNVMVFTFVLWSQEPNSPNPTADVYFQLARYLGLLFTTPVLLMLGGPLVEAAWVELRAGRPSLHGLLAVGVLAAFAFSVISVLRGQGHVYFEVSCSVLVFVTLGRWFEATGKLRTTAALRSLQQLLPEQVRLVRDGQTTFVPRDTVRPGDLVRVLAGERIPVDGHIVRNRASIDQQVITGESLPVVRETGDVVLAGTLNLDGDLWIDATSGADSGLIARLIESVAGAATEREPYQRLAARVSRRFVPLVAAITLATCAWHAWTSDLPTATLAALSVAVIACPCALGLATPMALWAALGRAAQARILVQQPDALSSLAEADTIFFDKTGTLTTGQPRLRALIATQEISLDEVWAVALPLANASNHPLACALVDGWTAQAHASWDRPRTTCVEVSAIETLPGRGLRGWRHDLGQVVWLGSRRLMREAGQNLDSLAEHLDADDGDLAAECYIGWGSAVRGLATFDEKFRPQAAATLAWFGQQRWCVAVLTGDGRKRGDQLGAAWHVMVHSELLPAQKLGAIRAARHAGHRVVMVGDGINDAPALAAADVGIALGCGADVSRLSAAVCLVDDDLRQLPWLVELARRTADTVRWNLLWAFGYNLIGIGIAAAGWLHPAIAALAMVVSSVLVVSNSLRLAHWPLPPHDRAPCDARLPTTPVEVAT